MKFTEKEQAQKQKFNLKFDKNLILQATYEIAI